MSFVVERIDWTEGEAAYYADDLMAIRAGAESDGVLYRGAAITPGHDRVRSPARAILLRVQATDGSVAWGDAVAPQYAGVGGRDLPIDPSRLAAQVDFAAAALQAAGPLDFVGACALLEGLTLEERPLHTGLRYGLSQALLGVAARSAGTTPLRILADITGLVEPMPVPIYAQSGEDRRRNVDRMILRRVDVIPHGLINAPTAFGEDGELFLDYVRWVVQRIEQVGEEGYEPRLHFDVYGMLGDRTGNDVPTMACFCARLAVAAGGRPVQLESPCYGADVDETIALLAALRSTLQAEGTPVGLVADEYCNGVDDVRRFVAAGAVDLVQIKMPDLGSLTEAIAAAEVCRQGGLGVFIGGSCAETDLSAHATVDVALAVRADQVLAKPGMGVDEGVAIVRNAMARSLLDWRRTA